MATIKTIRDEREYAVRYLLEQWHSEGKHLPGWSFGYSFRYMDALTGDDKWGGDGTADALTSANGWAIYKLLLVKADEQKRDYNIAAKVEPIRP